MRKWMASLTGWRWWVFLLGAFIVLPTLGFLTMWLGGRLVWELTGIEDMYNVSCGCSVIVDDIFNISDDYALKKWWCFNRKTYLFNH